MTTQEYDKIQTSLHNYTRALKALEEAVATDPVDGRDYAGIIKSFEFVYELAWVTLKRILIAQGHEVQAARSAFSTSYKLGLLKDEGLWLAMIADRNLTVHAYDESFSHALCSRIKDSFMPGFRELASLFAIEIEKF